MISDVEVKNMSEPAEFAEAGDVLSFDEALVLGFDPGGFTDDVPLPTSTGE